MIPRLILESLVTIMGGVEALALGGAAALLILLSWAALTGGNPGLPIDNRPRLAAALLAIITLTLPQVAAPGLPLLAAAAGMESALPPLVPLALSIVVESSLATGGGGSLLE